MEKEKHTNILLFSIDFEDIRMLVPDGMKYSERVPAMMEKYLTFLQNKNAKATFFVVGNTVKLYSSLLKDIAKEGHEIACHTHNHIPLDQHTKASFREDILLNIDALTSIGCEQPKGFRAPGLSLTAKTQWAYDVLQELGFTYSSSVMATNSAFHSWADFGKEFKEVKKGFWELPPTLMENNFLCFPFASSVYFRFLPAFVSRNALRIKFNKKSPIISYFHAFDIDYEQEHFMHPGVNDNRLFNFLMYYNRKGMLEKFESVLPDNYTIMPHGEYVKNILMQTNKIKPIVSKTAVDIGCTATPLHTEVLSANTAK
ncbi:MAG: polysaccharide deacetylase family protein [Bacteroidia bacterium]